MRNRLIGEIDEFKEARNYWTKSLSSEWQECRLPADVLVGATGDIGEFPFQWDRSQSEKMFSRCRENHLALFTLLLSTLNIALRCYCNTSTPIVAAPVFNSSNLCYNRMIPFRTTIEPALPFKRYLGLVKETVEQGYKNEHFPLEELASESGEGHSLAFAGVALVLENIHNKESAISCHELNDGAVVFVCCHNGECIKGAVRYPRQRYQPDTVSRIADSWNRVICGVLEAPDAPILSIDVMSPQERRLLLDTFGGGSQISSGREKTVIGMFEEAALRKADSVAVSSTIDMVNIYDELRPEQIPIDISFGQLNSRANRLAGILRQHGAVPGGIVALWLRHPLETVVAILGVLKSGASYLPLDTGYPAKINRYILDDSAAGIIVTEPSLAGDLPEVSKAPYVIMVDDCGEGVGDFDPQVLIHPEDLAYAIYTSGTTGKPKGVLVEHRGIANYAGWRIAAYEYCDTDVTLQLLPYSFDGFCSNFYCGLLCGGRLVMAPEDKRLDISYIVTCIRDLGVTNMSLVPGVFRLLLDGATADGLKSLRLVVLAGERSDESLLQKSRQLAPNARMVNEYGPTEATVAAAANQDLSPMSTAVIGRPIANTSIYIMDECRQLQPMKAPGELCIAGAGVSRGYLNQPELTADRFVENPLIKGETLYLSGDVAQFLPDGNIRLSGRLDHQVKIRGYRIELDAVQLALAACEGVDDAVVVAWKDLNGEAALVGYVVPIEERSPEEFDPALLKKRLADLLPDYMIPTFLLPLKRIPLTANGKLDQQALPQPGHAILVEATAPRNRVEEILTEIWAEVLGIEAPVIGIDHSFFDIGGHSLKAAVLESMINKRFGVFLPLAEIFETPTIRQLAVAIEERDVHFNTDETDCQNLSLLRDGDGPNLIVIHDGSGELEAYLPLCNRLKPSVRCWGVRADRRDTVAPFIVNLEELARKYADIIIKAVPNGPLYITGWSAGGTIAFAVAHRLEACQRNVAMLGLLDAPAPHEGAITQALTVESELEWVFSLLPQLREEDSLRSAQSVEDLWKKVMEHILKFQITVADIETMIHTRRNLGIPASALQSTHTLLRFLNNGRSYVSARDRYSPPGLLNGEVVLFKANRADDDFKFEWNRYARRGLQVDEVDGDHFSLMQLPEVERLAEVFGRAMDRCSPLEKIESSEGDR